VDPIAHASIHVAVAVAVHAVGDVGVDKGKGFAVLKRAVFEDVEAVAVICQIFFFLCFRILNLHGRRITQLKSVTPDTRVGDVGVLAVRGEGDALQSS